MSDGGSDVGGFVRELEAALRCARCGQVADESFSSSVCQHTFCGSCVETVFAAPRSQCPACCVPLWRHNIRFNPVIANLVKYVADLVVHVSEKPTAASKARDDLLRQRDSAAHPDIPSDDAAAAYPNPTSSGRISAPIGNNDAGSDTEPEATNGDDAAGDRVATGTIVLPCDDLAASPPLMALRDDEETSPSWQPPANSLASLQQRHQELIQSYGEMNLSAVLSGLGQTDSVDANTCSNLSPACFSPTIAAKPPGKTVAFQTSGLTNQKRDIHERLLELGASAANDICECTHLVIAVDERNRCQRTLKYATALLRGSWIVSEKWVEQCSDKGRWVDECDYEVVGDASVPDVMNTPRRSRLSLVSVFAGCNLALDEGSEIPDLAPLIRLGGGRVVQPDPGSDASSGVLLICEHELSAKRCERNQSASIRNQLVVRARQLAKHFGVVPVSIAWLFDCCSHLEQIAWQPYRLDQ